MRITAGLVCLLVALLSGCGETDTEGLQTTTPNILFVVMDDVGIDQMQDFGYGGDTPPNMPNITAIADAGLRFRNTWAMPACSTSRAVFYDGRYPLRTNVKGALGADDLSNSMVSPYEITVPKLLAQQGYESALFGKFHIALQGNDSAGLAMPHDRGWDYFAGWLDETGDPSSIDTTAGGVAPKNSWPCGFVGGASAGGVDRGACYFADGTCMELSAGPIPPGRACRDRGGLFDLPPPQGGVSESRCQPQPPPYLDFSKLSAHYVSPLVYNYPDGSVLEVEPTDPRARRFRAAFVVDAAIEWIKQRPDGRPWMATVSFASDHTPLMQPPYDPALPDSAEASDLDCSDEGAQRVLSDMMIESLDLEVGRLLTAIGLARHDRDGKLIYVPDRNNTMVVVLGDNGSLGTTVKEPFDPSRAKGTAYQTGVWVPLIVAGPLVHAPHRDVRYMVNVADLFALFGELAGISDVPARVPRPIDAYPMLPYLTNPEQPSLRAWNYTEVGINLQVDGAIYAPCVISGGCTQIPVSQSVCEDNNGVWWGPGHDAEVTDGAPDEGFQFCCEVNQFVVEKNVPDTPYTITPLVSVAIRNDRYKIVENSLKAYVSQEQPCVDRTTTEFFEIDELAPLPKLDYEGSELPIDALTEEQQENYDELTAQLAAIRASVPECPGDGNIDFVVNQADLDGWQSFAQPWGKSSVYDINVDGLTDAADQAIIEENLGLQCTGGSITP